MNNKISDFPEKIPNENNQIINDSLVDYKIEVYNILNYDNAFWHFSDELSQLYLEIFSNPSWNDWEYDFDKKYSISTKAWKVVRTSEDQKEKILQEIMWKDLVSYFIENEKILSWFIYWWMSSIDKLNTDKFNLSDYNFINLEKRLDTFWVDNWEKIMYLSQLWLSEKQRWKWYGKRLIQNFTSQSKLLGANFLILRTSKNRFMPYKYILQNYYSNVVYEYSDYSENVIIIIKI